MSLFLAEGIQAATGRVVLPGPFAPAVGTVTTYDMSGNVESCEKLDMPCLQVGACAGGAGMQPGRDHVCLVAGGTAVQ